MEKLTMNDCFKRRLDDIFESLKARGIKNALFFLR